MYQYKYLYLLCNHKLKLDQVDMTSDDGPRGSEFDSHSYNIFITFFLPHQKIKGMGEVVGSPEKTDVRRKKYVS